MARRRNTPDPNQMALDFQFEKRITDLVNITRELQDAYDQPAGLGASNDFEACNLLAASVKKAIDKSGLSRADAVDRINAYLGRTEEKAAKNPKECFKPLTLNMLNNMLAKPTEYKMPAVLLFAIHHVTGSLEPARCFAEAEGGAVVTAAERQRLNLLKVQDLMDQVKQAQTELKKTMRVGG